MGFDLTEFYAELRYDLKDSGALWSDAELKRCVERAVDDLSRFLPLERIHEVTYSYEVSSESFTTPAAASATYFISATGIASHAAGQTCTLTARTITNAGPVVLTITDTDTSITAFTVIVKGTDGDGKYIEEGFYFPGGLVQTGKQYFKTIVEVEWNYGSGNATGDTLSLGTTNAYDVWVNLANKPIRTGSESITSQSRDTDYTMDYANGRIKFINGGSMAAATAYSISYDKSRLGIDISDILPVLTRITHVEYPTENVPQQFVSYSIWNNFMYIGSPSAGTSQERISKDKHIAIYYERKHMPPSLHSDGSYPDYLDQVISIGAGAYALLMEALQYEHNAVTDIAYVDTALDKVATYLETSDTTDNAKDVLANVTDDIADLRTAIATAVDAANTYLDEVDTTDLGQATVGAEGLLETGDDKINVLNVGDNVPELYAEYSRVRAQIAQVRSAAAVGFVREAETRLDNLRTYIEEAGGWIRMGETFVAEAQSRMTNVGQYLIIADRFRAEGLERRNEFWAILRDKSEYRRRVSSVPVTQPAGGGAKVTTRARTDQLSY